MIAKIVMILPILSVIGKATLKNQPTSFLNHFIRIQPRDPVEKALLAPNQDIYLRENIRLRLQIAILAVPRQQNELYKKFA